MAETGNKIAVVTGAGTGVGFAGDGAGPAAIGSRSSRAVSFRRSAGTVAPFCS